jgi:hypothetical protein
VFDAAGAQGDEPRVDAQRQHGTGRRRLLQCLQCPGGRVDVGGHDGGEGLAQRRFHRRLPAGFDADQFEQRADDALVAGQVFGTGPGPGGVERHLERVDAGHGAGRRLCGLLAPGRGRFERHLELGDAQFGRLDVGDQRALERLGGRAVVAVLRTEPIELDDASVELVAPGLPLAQLGLDAVGGRAAGPQFAAHLGQGARRRRRRGRIDRGERLFAVDGEGRLVGLELLDVGDGAGDGRVDLVELVAKARRVGFEGGDHSFVEQLAAIALESSRALGDERHQAPGPLTQLVGPGEAVTHVVGAASRQLGAEDDDVGVELGQFGLERGLVGARLVAGGGQRRELGAQRTDLPPGDEDAQCPELLDELTVPLGRLCLPLERP